MCNQCLKEKIDRVVIRGIIVKICSSMGDFRILCADLTQALLLKGIDKPVRPELLDGENLKEKALSLLESFDKADMLPDLIEFVCMKYPHLKHHHFFIKKSVRNDERLLNHQHFDLDPLVDTFFKIVRESQGVVCFAIPCDYSEFLKIFCHRIEEELEHLPEFVENFDAQRSFILHYRFIDELINDINNIKYDNSHRYIPINIKLGKANKELTKLFWQRVYQEFHMLQDHVIIIIVMGGSDYPFPEDMVRLTPLFTEDDVEHWQLRIGTLQRWPPNHVKEHWKPRMLQESAWEENELDMELIYGHMDKVKGILLDNPAGFSFEEFFDQLKGRHLYP